MNIFEKQYDGESIVDLYRDVCEAIDYDFNEKVKLIPVDKNYIQTGTFTVKIEWNPD